MDAIICELPLTNNYFHCSLKPNKINLSIFEKRLKLREGIRGIMK